MTKIIKLKVDLEGKIYLKDKEIRVIPIGEPHIISNNYSLLSPFYEFLILNIKPKSANAYTIGKSILRLKEYTTICTSEDNPIRSRDYLFPIQFYCINGKK